MEFVRLDGWMVKRNSNIGRSQSIWGREMRFAAFLLDDRRIQLPDRGALFYLVSGANYKLPLSEIIKCVVKPICAYW